jgi:chitinase
LFVSFASVDPDTYKVKAWVEEDKALMRQFTKLKGKGRNLQPWIAVGGWSFSDPDQTTHTTWRPMFSAEQAVTFIASPIEFMDEYGFTGANLDWEYPRTSKCGGKLADEVNFVLLLKEMREAFGTKYGISLILAPDYWYLRYFDIGRLQNYVDNMVSDSSLSMLPLD